MPDSIVEKALEYVQQHPVSEILKYLWTSYFLSAAFAIFLFYVITCLVLVGTPKYVRVIWILLKKFYYQESKFYPILYTVVGGFYFFLWTMVWGQLKEVFTHHTSDFNNASLIIIFLMSVTKFRSFIFLIPRVANHAMMDIGWRLKEIEADS